MKTIDILSFGEPMIEFAEAEVEGARMFRAGYGGDSSNAAIAAARQGAKAAYFTALGDEAFGREFLELWDREGVDRSHVILRDHARTGIYFITYGGGGHHFTYYRAGSAASLVTPQEIPRGAIAASRVFLASGISQAISETCAAAVEAAIDHARETGTTVAYDTNFRPRLWPKEKASAVIHASVAKADIVKPSIEDAESLVGLTRPDAICDFYLGLGPTIVTLTLGGEGTLIATPEERRLIPARRVEVVDATGAGDTFTGAFLAEWLRTGDPFRAGEYANAAAGLSTQGQGAVAPMPTRAAVEEALRS